MSEKVLLSVDGGVATVTLNDPDKANACGVEVAKRLQEIVQDIELGKVPASALLLTGSGRFFSSGADLSAIPVDGSSPDLGASLESIYNPLLTSLRNLRIPMVTAVNGGAAGIGCSLALLGDLIVAGESAYFLQAFRNVGLVPDGGATWMLPRLVGRARAMEMVLLGERLSASTAFQWGLINRYVPDADLMQVAGELARKLASGPASLRLARSLVIGSEEEGWNEQLHREAQAQRSAGNTDDFREGVAAFSGKRRPSFVGH